MVSSILPKNEQKMTKSWIFSQDRDFLFFFWKNWRHHKLLSRFSDIYDVFALIKNEYLCQIYIKIINLTLIWQFSTNFLQKSQTPIWIKKKLLSQNLTVKFPKNVSKNGNPNLISLSSPPIHECYGSKPCQPNSACLG